MLIYNTTFHVEMGDARNFVIWLNEFYIPEVEKSGELKNPRILRILSHKEQDSECFSLQWEVEDSATLHVASLACKAGGCLEYGDDESVQG